MDGDVPLILWFDQDFEMTARLEKKGVLLYCVCNSVRKAIMHNWETVLLLLLLFFKFKVLSGRFLFGRFLTNDEPVDK